MKKLLRKKVCGSCEQCTRPTGQPQNALLNQKKKMLDTRRWHYKLYPNAAQVVSLKCRKFFRFLKKLDIIFFFFWFLSSSPIVFKLINFFNLITIKFSSNSFIINLFFTIFLLKLYNYAIK